MRGINVGKPVSVWITCEDENGIEHELYIPVAHFGEVSMDTYSTTFEIRTSGGWQISRPLGKRIKRKHKKEKA